MTDWLEFYKHRENYEYENPFWRDINASLPVTELEGKTLEDFAILLNKRKLTKYLNQTGGNNQDWIKNNIEPKFFNRSIEVDEQVTEKVAVETYAALDALEQLGLRDQYLKSMDSLKWRANIVNARHYYFASLIQNHVEKIRHRRLRILEIGGGSGTLAILLRTKIPVHHYVDVDFPEMCLINAFQTSDYLTTQGLKTTNEFRNNRDQSGTLFPNKPGYSVNLYVEPGFFFQK